MGRSTIEVEHEGRTVVISLDRPDALNAINMEMLEELEEEVSGVEDGSILVLKGSGESFCAGADIKEMSGYGEEEAERASSLAEDVTGHLSTSGNVTVAAVHGHCLGAGNEMALSCDFRIASEDAEFGQPELRVGIIPGFGATARLPRLVGLARAKSLVLGGERIKATEAMEMGLVDGVVEREDLEKEAREFAEDVRSSVSPRAYKKAKILLESSLEERMNEAVERERNNFKGLFGTPDQEEGMRAFLEKRDPDFGGG